MAYVDMARSHVKELVREGTGLSEVVEDCDGDLPFRCRSAAYFISTRSDGVKLKVWSRSVTDVKATVGLLREVNDANAGLECARVVIRGRQVYVEGVLPVETTTGEQLQGLCQEVATTADELDTMIAAVYGGSTWFSDDDTECTCGAED